MRLVGKTAIVTGGASGFGEGIVRRFIEEGCKVVIADINDQLGEQVADDIGSACIYCHCNVTSADDLNAAAQLATDSFGSLDIMVNNAGMPQTNQPMLDVDEDTFQKIFDVNVKSIFLSAKAVVPIMREQGSGSIINTASSAALRPRPGLVWYNASKGAATTMTKAMAIELAPDQIRVNALCPVAGDTPMLGAFMGGEITNEMKSAFISTIPMGRFSTPRDMANAALFFASDDSEFITGVCMEVDGGRCI
ncbi:MAG: glucose 1-dehydrogenase [Anderseniella sp.]|nr:glucose 1-dehydrogenase [Anderseniella sp.]